MPAHFPPIDLFESIYASLHDPDDYAPARRCAAGLRAQGSWGLVYRSVRHPGGECIAALRPPTVSVPKQGPHLRYVWDGRLQRITEVLEVRRLRGRS